MSKILLIFIVLLSTKSEEPQFKNDCTFTSFKHTFDGSLSYKYKRRNLADSKDFLKFIKQKPIPKFDGFIFTDYSFKSDNLLLNSIISPITYLPSFRQHFNKLILSVLTI